MFHVEHNGKNLANMIGFFTTTGGFAESEPNRNVPRGTFMEY